MPVLIKIDEHWHFVTTYTQCEIKVKTKSINKYYLYALLFFLVVIIPMSYMQNMGGSGFNLPQNLLAICALTFFIASVVLSKRKMQNEGFKIGLHGTVYLFTIAVASHAITFLWGGLSIKNLTSFFVYFLFYVFFICLLQVKITLSSRRFILTLIVIGGVIQAIISYLQMLNPMEGWMEYYASHGRIYGSFQQPNLLASFEAVSIGLSFYFFMEARTKLNYFFSLVSIVFMAITVPLIQSRIGYVSLAATIMMLCWHYRFKFRILVAAALLGTSIAAGMFFLSTVSEPVESSALPLSEVKPFINNVVNTLPIVNHTTSTQVRLIVLKYTLKLIALNPWQGWGAGNFEYFLPRLAIANNDPSAVEMLNNMTHPHNEILYRWAEGGLLGLFGCLLLIYAWLSPLLTRNKRQRIRAFPLLVCSLPVVLHSMVEYPVYQSALHGIVLLILLRLACNQKKFVAINLSQRGALITRASAIVFSIVLIGLSLTALKTQSNLTHSERNGFRDIEKIAKNINPWMHWERLQFDRHMAMLLRYNQTKDMQLLLSFRTWGYRYIKARNDANVWFSLMKIAQLRGKSAEASILSDNAHLLFPQDARFKGFER